jgi:tetratricopeptide (TPR) repeat protein
MPIEEANRNVDPDLVRIVGKLLAKEPRARYATAEDLLVDLRSAATQHRTGHALGQRALTRQGWPVWAWLALGVSLMTVVTIPMWSRYLPNASAPPRVSHLDASEWVLAVLPSSAYSEADQDTRSLNDGLATTLTAGLTRLSQAHQLQVVPASSVFERSALTPAAANREFGVTLALTFSTQQFDQVVRVTTNLVDVRAERQIAAETIDGTVADLLGLQERVTRQVLRMLQVELRPLEQDYLQAGTDEPRAYTYYIRGLGYLENRTSPADLEVARGLLEQALRVDPDFAAAHARLGEAFWHEYVATLEPHWMEDASDACTRATELDAMDASGQVCLGWLLLETGKAEDAAARFERAIDLDPTRDDAFRGLASAQQALNRTDLAEQTYREAIAMRPHYWNGHRQLAAFLYTEGRYAEAIESFEEVVRLVPDSYAGFADLGAAYYQAGEWVDARRALEQALELNPDDALATSNLGTLEFYEHDYERAAELFEHAVELRPRDSIAWGNLAETLELLGRDARGAVALERALELTAAELEVNPAFPWTLADRSLYLARSGDESALDLLQRARELAGDDPEILLIGARVAQELGRSDLALDLIEASLAGGTLSRIVERDPTFDDLHATPRWQELVTGPDR